MNGDRQIVEARHVSTDFDIGDLQSREWDLAQPIKIDHYWSGQPAPAGRHAEARILWSKEALHLRFVCNQAEPLVISDQPQTKTKTMNLWDRDVCEIFISPDPAVVERYLEFEVAPSGEWLDVAIDLTSGERQSDWQFSSGMTAAALIEVDRVTMAMRIPWSDHLPKPEIGDRRRVNLFRCVGRDPKLRYLAWQPTHTPEPFFHVPQVFGWLVF